MARKIQLNATKTYATEDNADKAIERFPSIVAADVNYFIARTADGRFFPVFIGAKAVNLGIHFHFHVVG